MIYYITKTNPRLESLDLTEVEVLPLLTLKTIFVPNFSELFLRSDGLIFTSKNAIFALEENLLHSKDSNVLMRHWRNLPNYVLGSSSAILLQKMGLQVEYVASVAYGDVFAQEIITHLQGKKPLFARAKKIASSLPLVLQESGIALESVAVYENSLLKLQNTPTLQEKSIIFFSAPSHIHAFLLNFKWKPCFIALCLGETTKKTAQKLLSNAEILQSPEVKISSALEFAREELKRRFKG